MKINIIGVDISLRSSGFAVYNTGTDSYPYFGIFQYKPKFEYDYASFMDYQQSLNTYFTSTVLPYCEANAPILFVVEGITNRGHFHSTIKIMTARTAVFSLIKQTETSGWHCDVIVPKVQDWKKSIIGKGNANKEDTRKWLADRRTRYKVPFPVYDNDDIVDAVSLILYGRKVFLKEAIR